MTFLYLHPLLAFRESVSEIRLKLASKYSALGFKVYLATSRSNGDVSGDHGLEKYQRVFKSFLCSFAVMGNDAMKMRTKTTYIQKVFYNGGIQLF